MQLYALGSGKAVSLSPLKGLTAVGGSKSTGLRIHGLKFEDDYCVVTEADGHAVVHVLKGKKRGQITVEAGGLCTVEDLTLCLLPEAESLKGDPHDPFAQGFEDLLKKFSSEGPLEPVLLSFLQRMLRATDMEKGILLTRDAKGNYRAVATSGLDEGDPWLSEAIVQDALRTQQPVWLQNRVGSAFELSKSLISAGFLSVFALPLVARGESLGAVVLGSVRPHGGLSELQRSRTEAYSRLGALIFWFQQREEALRAQLSKLEAARGESNCPLLTASAKLQQELSIAQRVAATRLGMLIQGETGVGKELMAQWIHEQSERKNGPFVAINCGAIPSELLESILFGHRKGAFTGAVSDQAGKFQLAHGGTLLLDEIGDLPERLQVKLLRVLQEGQIEPLGSPRPVKVDVRILAATHRNLLELVKQGRFRQDLYYRIAETVVSIPALRERPEDVALLASYFLKDSGKTIPLPTLEWLSGRAWPGNVRELRSAVQRAAALSPGKELREADFLVGLPKENESEQSAHWLEGMDLEQAKQAFVQKKIRLALERSGGNRQKAADLLGVTARTLFRYLEDDRERQGSQDA